MLCRQCEETLGPGGCVKGGVCGKSAETAEIQDILIDSLIVLAGKAANGEADMKAAGTNIVDGLFATLTNTDFDTARLSAMADANYRSAGAVRPSSATEIGVLSYDSNADLRSLKELLLYGCKGLAAYYHHAAVLGYSDEKVPEFLIKALPSLRKDFDAEGLVSLVMECGAVGVECMALLDRANTETYGIPSPTDVSTCVGKRPGILVTGHDLHDLKMILEQARNSGVDIYTHGEMLPANAYPELKKYGIVGNYGGAWYQQKDDFERFNGPIIVTTNCIVPPKDSYRNRLFTTGPAGYAGVKHIAAAADGSKDFSAVIEMAKSCKPPEQIENGKIITGCGHDAVLGMADKIVGAVKAGKIKRFVVLAGCDGRQKERSYYTEMALTLPKDTIILTAGCAKYRFNKLDLGDIEGIPRIVDAGQCNDCYSLVVIALALAKEFGTDVNGLPLSFDISWYEQKAVLVLLALLNLGVKNIMLGPRLPAFVTPGILKVLVDNFGLQANSNVQDDIRILNIA
jgi:hydroxylamine reductase